MKSKTTRRQLIRRSLIFLFFLSFPLTFNYLSPYLIIDGAFEGIVSGSMILFGLLFLSSLFLGRAWCSWVCPAGGLQDACAAVRERKVHRLDWIKFVIWVPWLATILFAFFQAGGILAIDPFHKTDNGISINQPLSFITYYLVVILIILPCLLLGTRAFCHTACWMAPFMMAGRKLRNLFQWPALHLRAQTTACTDCKACTRNCPMSLDVNALVRSGSMEHSECILCGNCVDTCARDVIHYAFLQK